MALSSAKALFGKIWGSSSAREHTKPAVSNSHPSSQLGCDPFPGLNTPTAKRQHILVCAPDVPHIDTTRQAPDVKKAGLVDKSDEQSIVVAQGQDDAPSPTLRAIPDTSKQAGVISRARKKQSTVGNDVELKRPATEVMPPNDTMTYYPANARQPENSANNSHARPLTETIPRRDPTTKEGSTRFTSGRSSVREDSIDVNGRGEVSVLPNTTKPIGFVSILSQTNFEGHHGDADEELALLGPPWIKEGILTSPRKGAKSGIWQSVFAVVHKGDFRTFKFGGHSAGGSGGPVGGGNWLENANPVHHLKLAHSMAQACSPPGYPDQRPCCMALTLADGRDYFFQAGTEELVKEWVSTCNYWAARRSKIMSPGSDSNEEYGWNHVSSTPASGNATASVVDNDTGRRKYDTATKWVRRLSQSERIVIKDWKPPPLPQEASTLEEEVQVAAMKNQVLSLETRLREHFELVNPMNTKYKSHPGNAAKVQENWKKRANYLQAEVAKYRLYIESLRRAIELRSARSS